MIITEEQLRRLGLFYRQPEKQTCGAKTRRGTPCKAQGLGRGGRCRNHGGMSTGPKTIEGRQRISQVQRRRWAQYRKERGSIKR